MKTVTKICIDKTAGNVKFIIEITEPSHLEHNSDIENFYYYDHFGTILSLNDAKQYLEVNSK